MNDANTNLNAGSNANDFQPSTQNPQALGSSSLQTPATGLQPDQTTGASAEQLYQQADRQPGLTVQTDSYGGNSPVSVRPFEPHSDSGLITVGSALLIICLI